jgi:hypothetical protein
MMDVKIIHILPGYHIDHSVPSVVDLFQIRQLLFLNLSEQGEIVKDCFCHYLLPVLISILCSSVFALNNCAFTVPMGILSSAEISS